MVAGYTASFGAGQADFWVLKLDSTGGVSWQKTYGGSGDDEAYSVQQTSDGGYIVAGYTNSFGAGGYDFWILKLNSTGGVTWQKTYGGNSNDEAYSVHQTSDGGYIVAGYATSFGAGQADFWILRLNSTGSVTWQKTYGGNVWDYANSVQQTTDGGYIVTGETSSFGVGGYHIWVLKLDSSGDVTWQKTYGGSGYDWAYSVQQTADGGYVVAGYTASYGAGHDDVWVLRLNSTGSVTWQKTYGGSGWDDAYSIQQTSDGGYIVVGCTDSISAGWSYVWVLKLNSTGWVMWQNAYVGSVETYRYSIKQTADGGYIVAGSVVSLDSLSFDVWVLKLGAGGEIVWNVGSGASTYTTNFIFPNSSASTSTTSVTPTKSAATATDTVATVQDTHAIIKVQSGGTTGSSGNGSVISGPNGNSPGGTGPGGSEPGGSGATSTFPLMIITVAPIALVLIALVVIRARRTVSEKTSPLSEASPSSWNDMNTDEQEDSIIVEGEALGTCAVCNLNIDDREGSVWCPFCDHVFHKIHLLEWIHVKSCCPVCQHHLTEEDLK